MDNGNPSARRGSTFIFLTCELQDLIFLFAQGLVSVYRPFWACFGFKPNRCLRRCIYHNFRQRCTFNRRIAVDDILYVGHRGNYRSMPLKTSDTLLPIQHIQKFIPRLAVPVFGRTPTFITFVSSFCFIAFVLFLL
jgi:hypothetical protein